MIRIIKSGEVTISNVSGVYKGSDEVIKIYHGTNLVYLKITYVWQYRVVIDSATYTDVGANGSTTANPTITAHIELRQAFSNNTYGPWSILSGETVTITYAGSSASNGGTLNTTTGKVTANGRGTTTGNRRKVITVTVTATGNISSHPTASTSIDVYQQANAKTGTTYGTPSFSGSFSAAGGTVTASVTNVDSYTSGSTANVTGSCSVTSTNTTYFTVSGQSVSHSGMGTRTGTDSTTLKATNSNDSSKTKSLNFSVTNSTSVVWDDWGTLVNPTVSIGTGLTAAGGSATVTHANVNIPRYYHYKYTSGSEENANARSGTYTTVATTISITSNGNNRFSLSGNTLSHSSMGTSVTTDSVTVQASYTYNSTTKTNTATASVNNTKTRTWGDYVSYGTPTTSQVSNSINLSGGYARIKVYVTDVRKYTDSYTSGSSSTGQNDYSGNFALFLNNENRWGLNMITSGSPSGGTFDLDHYDMTTNEGTDTATVTISNSRDSSKKTDVTYSSGANVPTFSWPTLSAGAISGGTIGAGGGDITVSNTTSPTGTSVTVDITWTTGSTSTVSASRSVHWTSSNSTISVSGTSLTTTASASSRGTTEGNQISSTITRYVRWTTSSYNKHQEVSATTTVYQSANTKSKTYGDYRSYGQPSYTTNSNNISASGGSAVITVSVTDSRYYYYTYSSGSTVDNGNYENVTGGFTSTISNTTRFSSSTSGSKITVTHSNMTTNAGTDSTTITIRNSRSNTKFITFSPSATNSATFSWPSGMHGGAITGGTISASGGSVTCDNYADATGNVTVSVSYTSGSSNTTTGYRDAYSWSKSGDSNLSWNSSTHVVSASSRGTTVGTARTATVYRTTTWSASVGGASDTKSINVSVSVTLSKNEVSSFTISQSYSYSNASSGTHDGNSLPSSYTTDKRRNDKTYDLSPSSNSVTLDKVYYDSGSYVSNTSSFSLSSSSTYSSSDTNKVRFPSSSSASIRVQRNTTGSNRYTTLTKTTSATLTVPAAYRVNGSSTTLSVSGQTATTTFAQTASGKIRLYNTSNTKEYVLLLSSDPGPGSTFIPQSSHNIYEIPAYGYYDITNSGSIKVDSDRNNGNDVTINTDGAKIWCLKSTDKNTFNLGSCYFYFYIYEDIVIDVISFSNNWLVGETYQ